MTPKSNTRKSSRIKMTPTRWAIVASCAIVAILVGYLLIFVLAVKAPADAYIRVPEGATGKSLNDSLSKYLGDSYASKVMMLVAAADTTRVRSGAYRIARGTRVFTTAKKIRGHHQDPVKLTVNGFRSLDDLTKRLASKTSVSADTLNSLLDNPEILKQYGLDPGQGIALFINDTYEVMWDIDAKRLLETFGKHYNKVWNEERVQKATSLGLTPAEVMTICSIVDEETNDESEKGRIGRLYINRLKKGMRLQADPTVRFALGDFSIRRVTSDHLSFDSPFNTYRYKGLPPAPIRTTSVSTIDAVLDSKPSDDLYMCAKADFSGSHNFASTFEEHARYAAEYRKALDEKGIK